MRISDEVQEIRKSCRRRTPFVVIVMAGMVGVTPTGTVVVVAGIVTTTCDRERVKLASCELIKIMNLRRSS